MVFLFALTAFLAAALLFIVEPMFGRMVLPLLGGSPAVWNTVMVFYQAVLLGGYAYAHALGRTTSSGRSDRRWWFHIVAMAAVLALLPVHLASGLRPAAGVPPAVWLLGLMVVTVGAPFLLVSTTGPLVQRWFARTGHVGARDPYFLYAASNLGSMLGLLAYPFLVEPRWTLTQQSRFWAGGYAALVVLVAICAIAAHRSHPEAASGAPESGGGDLAGPAREPVTTGRRLRWVLLAFVPSSLMLAVTTHLSIDIAAIPLLWVLPLGVYLLTFILAFAQRRLLSPDVSTRLLCYAALGVLIVREAHAVEPLGLVVGLHLFVLFAAAMVCHGQLAETRPGIEHLTEFYLWLALGGVLGGVFNALIAPLVFRSVTEYPLGLVLACLLAPASVAVARRKRGAEADPSASAAPARAPSKAELRRDVFVAAVFAAVLLPVLFTLRAVLPATVPVLVAFLAVLCLPLFALRRRPVRFGLALGSVMVLVPMMIAVTGKTLHAERSFFGVHRVQETRDSTGTMHRLVHGTTVHGLQWATPDGCRTPLGYYHRSGPAAQIFAAFGDTTRAHDIGLAGLGAGGLSAYGQAGQRWTYFEIDPAVVRIASNPAWFCYLEHCPATIHIQVGDARLEMAKAHTRFDLIVLDAYTSDAIPVHLLTREAMAMYLDHLAPNGVLAMHLSNRYFDLVPVVSRLAHDAHLAIRVCDEGSISPAQLARGIFPSRWAVLARDEALLAPVAARTNWHVPPHPERGPLWTDDFSSLFAVLR